MQRARSLETFRSALKPEKGVYSHRPLNADHNLHFIFRKKKITFIFNASSRCKVRERAVEKRLEKERASVKGTERASERKRERERAIKRACV